MNVLAAKSESAARAWTGRLRSVVGMVAASLMVAGIALVAAPTASASTTVPGHLDSWTKAYNSGYRIAGWTFDTRSKGTSISVAVTSDGRQIMYGPTNIYRSDVNRVYGIGGVHGFILFPDVPSGRHYVCVYGVGITGSRNLIRCFYSS